MTSPSRTSRPTLSSPIFVGPYAGTGGIADTISISAANPYNPFGIDLIPGQNFGWITKRPVEVGPRIFNQDVDTTYFNIGLDGLFNLGDRSFSWDANYVHAENKAEQVPTEKHDLVKHMLVDGAWRLTMVTARDNPRPVMMLLSKDGKVTWAIRYTGYTTQDAADPALFAKPEGIKFTEPLK